MISSLTCKTRSASLSGRKIQRTHYGQTGGNVKCAERESSKQSDRQRKIWLGGGDNG